MAVSQLSMICFANNARHSEQFWDPFDEIGFNVISANEYP